MSEKNRKAPGKPPVKVLELVFHIRHYPSPCTLSRVLAHVVRGSNLEKHRPNRGVSKTSVYSPRFIPFKSCFSAYLYACTSFKSNRVKYAERSLFRRSVICYTAIRADGEEVSLSEDHNLCITPHPAPKRNIFGEPVFRRYYTHVYGREIFPKILIFQTFREQDFLQAFYGTKSLAKSSQTFSR